MMTQIRPITPRFAVAPSPGPGFFAAAAEAGFTTVVNNRPDGEDPAQLSSAEAQAAAQAAGLAYVHIPVTGGPGAPEAEALRDLLVNVSGPVLAYCRSGTRSAATFALAQALRGADTQETLALIQAAGYDLRALAGEMDRLRDQSGR
jgi:uncharacterized protein (TIGR01244 family)